MPPISALATSAAQPARRAQSTQEMILGCLPLVNSMARRLYGALPPNSGVELHDLAQSGVLGLMSAGRGYDPDAAVPFSIYARYRIEGEMLDSLRRSDVAPRRLRRWQKQVNAARLELSLQLHREPVEEELCERLGISPTELRGKHAAMSPAVAAASQGRDGDPVDPASGPETGPDHICSRRQLREMLNHLMGRLPAQHREVIRQRYSQHLTLKEIGAGMGVTESRVSQMHRSALQAMSRMLKGSGISSAADV
jgi:RNA polymerase sigma factor FliA